MSGIYLKFEHLFNDKILIPKIKPGQYTRVAQVLGPYDKRSEDIYFIVTGDIEGVTLDDHIKRMLNPLFNQHGILTNDKLAINNFINILFELIYGLYILNNRLNIIHNDIHFGNIIFKEIPDREKIYTINNIDISKNKTLDYVYMILIIHIFKVIITQI